MFGRSNPLALALEVAFCCLVRIWHVLVDERDGELGPRGVITIPDCIDELFYQRKVWRALGRSKIALMASVVGEVGMLVLLVLSSSGSF